ncbi:Aldehyde/histidinol dehydrogenase [Aspergillus pseudoustus]|uniref:aldehyde dehydrogenase (NAD(+)) n=1 Tax=Aspergillus pseudoustus TaxID=1810923 RepID=A0ABR4JGV6_9EURO
MSSVSESLNVFGEYYNIINGERQRTTKTRNGIDPATGQSLPEVPVATENDVYNTVEAAKAAFKIWPLVSWADRRRAILAYLTEIEGLADDLARLLTLEQGKPLIFAKMEITSALDFSRVLAKMELEEETIYSDPDRKTVIRYTPLGVAVAIVPWNFPIQLALTKIVPALVTGNPIILKPSPFTPYCGLKIVELAQKFFPKGVLQFLSGDDNLGPWLTAHPDVAKISFTGSSFTGKKVMESASKTLKRVTLELGGNDPANIAAVAPKIVEFSFVNSGQVCVAIKRIYVHEDIYEPFLDAMVAYIKTLSIGDGLETGNFFGPVQNLQQFTHVKRFFADIENEKLTVAVGGKNEVRPGYFITPTIIDRPPDNSRIATMEPFGPIVPVMQWKDEEDVIARANSTSMGLGASVWSSSPENASRIARQLQAGSVWVNTHLQLNPSAPFGGHKESGIGHELGLGSLKSYCNIQSLFLIKNPI